MGGTGFTIRLKTIRGAEPTPEKLYDELYGIIEDNIRRVAKGRPYKQVTEDFLGIAREDGAGRAGEIDFGFRDGAGLCQASVHACNHWFQLFVSLLAKTKGKASSPLDAIAARHGVALAKRPPELKAALSTTAPLVEIRGHLFGVELDGKEPYLVSDDLDEDRIEIEDLTKKERAVVDALLAKKRCACKVCATLRKPFTPKLPKPAKAPRAKKPPKLGVKTSLSRDKLHLNISDSACTALPDAVFAPSTVQSVYINAPITDVPETITTLPALTRVSFSATKMMALPEVLTRLPSVVDLWVSYGPIESLELLARLPWLTRLRLDSVRAIGPKIHEVPFAKLEALASLTLVYLELVEIPSSVATLPSLRELSVSETKLEGLPEALLANEHLEVLELRGFKSTELPSLSRMKKLRKLVLESDELVSVPDLPPDLVELSLECSKMATLPEALGELTHLESLAITAPVTTLPNALGKLSKLASLRLSATSFVALPSIVGKLDGLRDLSIAWCKIETIPEGSLPVGLTSLDFIRCPELRVLPESIGELKNLTKLEVMESKLTSLPKTIRKLKKLDSLAIRESPDFAELPSWLGDLRALDHLGLSDLPKLTALPDSIAKLTKLTWLILDGTPVLPLAKALDALPLERLAVGRLKQSKADREKLQRRFPKADITIR